jgi:DNA-binding response OmpR family regulator
MKILIIDSNRKLADAINRELEEPQFEFNYAADGEVGLKVALGKNFDLIVLSWALPKKDGLSVLMELRSHKNLTPVLMLIEQDSAKDDILSLVSGANACLTKPIVIHVLIAKIKALLLSSKWDRGVDISFASVRHYQVAGLPEVITLPPIDSLQGHKLSTGKMETSDDSPMAK